MREIAQWKLWGLWGLVTLICFTSFGISWGYACALGLLTALLFQFIQNRSVSKYYEALIEDNYTLAKQYDYKVTEIYRDIGFKAYRLEKTFVISQSEIKVTMYIKRSGVSFHYTPIDMIDMVHLNSDADFSLNLHTINAVESHASGDRELRPQLI